MSNVPSRTLPPRPPSASPLALLRVNTARTDAMRVCHKNGSWRLRWRCKWRAPLELRPSAASCVSSSTRRCAPLACPEANAAAAAAAAALSAAPLGRELLEVEADADVANELKVQASVEPSDVECVAAALTPTPTPDAPAALAPSGLASDVPSGRPAAAAGDVDAE